MPAAFRQTSPVTVGILAVLAVLTIGLGTISTRVEPSILLAGVAGIGVFILSFASTRSALYFLVVAALLSPEFGARSTQGSGVTLRLDDLLLLVIGFAQLTKSAVHRDIGLFSWTPLNRYITYYMLTCVFATGMGIIFGRVQPLTGFFFVLKYFEYFIVYFMLVNNITTREEARRFLILILLTAAVVSVVAIAQIPAGGRVVAPFEGEDGEPNTLGGYLLLISTVVSGLLLRRDAVSKRSHQMILLGLLGLTTIPILFTLSRATWLAVIPAYAVLFLLSDRKAILGICGALVMIVAPFMVPESVVERALYTVETEQTQWGPASAGRVVRYHVRHILLGTDQILEIRAERLPPSPHPRIWRDRVALYRCAVPACAPGDGACRAHYLSAPAMGYSEAGNAGLQDGSGSPLPRRRARLRCRHGGDGDSRSDGQHVHHCANNGALLDVDCPRCGRAHAHGGKRNRARSPARPATQGVALRSATGTGRTASRRRVLTGGVDRRTLKPERPASSSGHDCR